MASLDDFRARLAVEPLTRNQLGAIYREFDRLGYDPADRAGRLEVSAILAGYPGELDTTKDLTMGEAGRLIRALESCRDLADLYAAERQAATPARSGPTWRQLVAAAVRKLGAP